MQFSPQLLRVALPFFSLPSEIDRKDRPKAHPTAHLVSISSGAQVAEEDPLQRGVNRTYTIRRSHDAQMFWPGGSPLAAGATGRSTGALTWRVTVFVPLPLLLRWCGESGCCSCCCCCCSGCCCCCWAEVVENRVGLFRFMKVCVGNVFVGLPPLQRVFFCNFASDEIETK